MSEENKTFQTVEQTVQPITHKRIITIMAACAAVGTILSFIFISARFGAGFLIGGVLSLINYYWLKISLRRVFESAEDNEKTGVSATKYLLRYAAFGALLLIVYLTKTVPMTAVVLGLSSFAFAILIEAFIRMFSSFFNKKDFI